jgi:hypothetical protein
MSDYIDPETFFISPENLVVVLSEFFKAFKSNPLLIMSMDEVLTIWNAEYALNEDGEYQILENDLKKFLTKINGIQADRIMAHIAKKGLAQLAHDGEQFWLIANKKA